jgi:hypothetical protein
VGPRVGLSSILILGAVVLLIAIAVGQNMGNRVLGQIATRPLALSATPVPTPTASADEPSGRANAALWKRHDVISVATDPGFPDPRVTPEPPPPETPRPTARPTRKPTSAPTADDGDAAPAYTSPAMPIPLVTHPPTEASPSDDSSGPSSAPPTPVETGRGAALAPKATFTGRSYPSLPPYSTGTPLP